MQAVVLHETGGVEVMQLVKDYPKPERGAGQVSQPLSLSITPTLHGWQGSSLLNAQCTCTCNAFCSALLKAPINPTALYAYTHLIITSSQPHLFISWLSCCRLLGMCAHAWPPVQVLVRIHSSSVNPVEIAESSGGPPIKLPKVRTWSQGDCQQVLSQAA
jgi:hypothetical protein